MDETKFEQYALLDQQIKALTDKKEALREVILDEMDAAGIKKFDMSLGGFSVSSRKTYTFPDYITEMAEQLKATQEKAKSTGEATFTEELSLRFTSVKF